MSKNNYLLILTLLLFSGCTWQSVDNQTETGIFLQSEELNSSLLLEATSEQTETSAGFEITESAEPTETPHETLTIIDEIPLENCDSIQYAGNDHLLLLGEQAKLLNLHTWEILGIFENPEPPFSLSDFVCCDVIAQDDGYALIGNIYTAETSDLVLLTYDSSFQLKEALNLNEMLQTECIDAYKLFEPGEQLLYSDNDGFYLYHLRTKERTTLLSFSSPAEVSTNDGITSVMSCNVLSETEQILFTGYYKPDKKSHDLYRTIASMKLDGTALQVISDERHLWGDVQAFGDFALIQETEDPQFDNENVVWYYDSSGKIISLPLTTKDENIYLFPSCKGEYYATRTKIPHQGYLLRIYASGDGHLVKEIPMMFETYGEDIRIGLNNICIHENSGKIILLIQGWKGGKDSTWLITFAI